MRIDCQCSSDDHNEKSIFSSKSNLISLTIDRKRLPGSGVCSLCKRPALLEFQKAFVVLSSLPVLQLCSNCSVRIACSSHWNSELSNQATS